MKYPKNELAQWVIAACMHYQITDVVISPGSRNAPLTIGFSNHPQINDYSIIDERAAAFVALGMAQQKGKAVALLCTSGTALLNYFPAIAEAFYSHVPLVVLSADRPAHLIDVGDGQTIQQKDVFGKHVVGSVQLIEGVSSTEVNKNLLKTAFETLFAKQQPIHINIPFDEPLYEYVEDLPSFDGVVEKNTADFEFSSKQINALKETWLSAEKVMVLVGCHHPDVALTEVLNEIGSWSQVLVLTETTSNLYLENAVNSIDQLLFPLTAEEKEALRPDLLITLGGLVISKRIKQVLRNFKPNTHWHVHPQTALDTFQCLSQFFPTKAHHLFEKIASFGAVSSSYHKDWMDVVKDRKNKHQEEITSIPYSDLKVFHEVVKTLPTNIQLHLSNSSVVRYAQLFDMPKGIKVYSNRGTSGIDGSTSTAIGAAMVVDEPVVFVTGDIGFFYDSNALWNNYVPSNFRIVLLNNFGGGIFKIIPGPKNSGALKHFETPHQLDASHLCQMHQWDYTCVSNENDLQQVLDTFYEPSEKPRLLEVQTPSQSNDEVLNNYFKALKA